MLEWNGLVKTFHNWDTYYLYEYARSFEIHGDGVPLLFSYEDKYCRFCYVVMKKDIALDNSFSSVLSKDRYFDLETPYGYGGPLTDYRCIPEESQKLFLQELKRFCHKEGIVSQFLRFHPLLENYDCLSGIIENRYLRDTIYIDTSDRSIIFQNMDSKNRNMVRKAEKAGVTIVRRPISEYIDFLNMYNETMARDCADNYYIFSEEYFQSLGSLKDNCYIFYAMLDGMPISGAILMSTDRMMHYHLAGSYTEFRNVSPGNLLLYEAANWACDNGIQRFHLGGGLAPDDNLFKFKKKFNKKGRTKFVVGRTIFDEVAYNKLLDVRAMQDSSFDRNNNFMIQYRR